MKNIAIIAAFSMSFILAAACDDAAPIQAPIQVVTPPDTEPEPVDPGPPEPPAPPAIVTDAGEPTAGGIIVHPLALDGRFVYGMGTPPSSRLARVGTSAAGLLSMPVFLQVDDGEVVIRALDRDTLRPVDGDEGVVEKYSYITMADGRLAIDFGRPRVSVEVVYNASCKFVLAKYGLESDPVYEDGLLTWTARETYQPEGCGGYGGHRPPGEEIHVHFLRRADANPGYEPRAVDPTSPFGFFLADTPKGSFLTRLPGVTPGGERGTVTYYIGEAVPPKYEAAVRQTFEAWNDALEVAIDQRPFVVENAPAGMVAWDPRYRVVMWDTAGRSEGAVAPFIEDPFTGELFETYVVLWLDDLDDLIASYDAFLEAHPDLDLSPSALPERQEHFGESWDMRVIREEIPSRALTPRAFPTRSFGMPELSRYMGAVAADLSDDELADIVVADFLLHEVGHNLGLRHNFLASADVAHKPDTIAATSTMDYLYGMTTPGPYDVDAMRYGYGDGALETGYLYCSDEHVYEDPACQQWDYGHPILWQLEELEAAAGEIAASASWGQVAETASRSRWSLLFETVRQFVNSRWETYDPGVDADAFEWMLGWISCDEACVGHPWFQAQWAITLMSAQYGIRVGWGADDVVWFDYPRLTGAQTARVREGLVGLLLDASRDFELKRRVVAALPEAGFSAAGDVLGSVAQQIEAMADPSDDEVELLELVSDARDQLRGG